MGDHSNSRKQYMCPAVWKVGGKYILKAQIRKASADKNVHVATCSCPPTPKKTREIISPFCRHSLLFNRKTENIMHLVCIPTGITCFRVTHFNLGLEIETFTLLKI